MPADSTLLPCCYHVLTPNLTVRTVEEKRIIEAGFTCTTELRMTTEQSSFFWGSGRREGAAGPHGLRARGYQSQGNTCVSNFLSSLLRACLLPSLPQPPVWAAISLDGEEQTHTGTGDIWGAVGAGDHFGVLLPASNLQAHVNGRDMGLGTLAVPWVDRSAGQGPGAGAGEPAPGHPAACPGPGV